MSAIQRLGLQKRHRESAGCRGGWAKALANCPELGNDISGAAIPMNFTKPFTLGVASSNSGPGEDEKAPQAVTSSFL